MNYIFATLCAAPHTGKHHVTREFIQDLTWFFHYAKTKNGLVLLRLSAKDRWIMKCNYSLLGGGAHAQTAYFTEKYPVEYVVSALHINCLEVMNLVTAIHPLFTVDLFNSIVHDFRSTGQWPKYSLSPAYWVMLLRQGNLISRALI